MKPQAYHASLLLLLFFTLTSHAINTRHDTPLVDYQKMGGNEAPFESSETTPDFSAVCAVIETTTGRGKKKKVFTDVIGSGTLIASRYVLTAAHVIASGKEKRPFVKNLSVRFGKDSENPDQEIEVVAIHTILDPVSKPFSSFAGRGRFTDRQHLKADLLDIAVLKLAAPPADVTPIPLASKKTKLAKQRVVFSGFGDVSNGEQHRERKWSPARYRLAGENIIDRDFPISPEAKDKPKKWTAADGGMIAFDFDSPASDETHNTLANEIKDKYLMEIFGDGKSASAPLPHEASTLPGDSGGPALIYTDGEWRIVGVCSYGTGFPIHKRHPKIQYGEIAVYTRTLNHFKWFRKLISEE